MKTIKLALAAALISSSLLSCGGSSSKDSLSTDTCGLLGLQTRIINGTACSDAGSPVVRITLRSRDNKIFLCSGTMLTPTQVLTAAHCFFEPIRSAYVEAGGQRANAVRVAVHPNVSAQPGAVFNDAAILTLATAVNLPTVPLLLSSNVKAGNKIAIYGYGQTENESPSNTTSGILRSGQMRVSSATTDHLFADFDGKSGSNTCFGDSGGPAILESQGRAGIVGLTSSGFATDCGAGDVSLFANTQGSSIVDFITAVIPNVPTI